MLGEQVAETRGVGFQATGPRPTEVGGRQQDEGTRRSDEAKRDELEGKGSRNNGGWENATLARQITGLEERAKAAESERTELSSVRAMQSRIAFGAWPVTAATAGTAGGRLTQPPQTRELLRHRRLAPPERTRLAFGGNLPPASSPKSGLPSPASSIKTTARRFGRREQEKPQAAKQIFSAQSLFQKPRNR